MAALKRELAEARRSKSDADRALKPAQDKYEVAREAAARDYRYSGAREVAEHVLATAKEAAFRAAARVQELERRVQQLAREEDYQVEFAAYRAEVARFLENDERLGFTHVSFNDFLLDGKQLAADGTKVAVAGVYQKFGDVAALLPRDPTAREQGNTRIPLLTENATRNMRSWMLNCIQTSSAGCNITLRGTATMCTKTTLVGSSSVPCLDVDDGWNVTRPRY